jgi:hypothetical protein
MENSSDFNYASQMLGVMTTFHLFLSLIHSQDIVIPSQGWKKSLFLPLQFVASSWHNFFLM